ncbi:MAG: hypothetical protein ABI183_14850, partial [Polyangiaceae bacterium]
AWSASGVLLPAISQDGATVAILVQKEDGTRMYSNAALEVHNVADDKVITSLPILVADDIVAAEGMPDAFHTTLPAYKTQAKARLDDANALLGKSKWTALRDQSGNPPKGDAGPLPLGAGDYYATLIKTGPTLMLKVKNTVNAQAGFVDTDVSSMLVPARKTPKPQKGNPMCRFTPFLAEVAFSDRAAVIRIGQSVEGNVWGCFEPSQWKVYPLNAAPTPTPSGAPMPSGAPSAALPK